MWRKSLVIAGILCLAIAIVPLGVAQLQMGDSISVPDVVCETNETVNVPINISNVQNGPVQTITFDLEYDNQTINITGIKAGELTPIAEGWQQQLGSNGESVTIATSSMDNTISNGSSGSITVLNCSFTEDAGESTWLNISDLDIANTALEHGTAVVINGSITANRAPAKPVNPSPSDAAPSVSLPSDLSWECSDPDGDDLTYDVYFCTCSNPPKAAGNLSSTSYDVSLDYSTTYHWKIVAWDEHGARNESDVWQFTTASQPQYTLNTDVSPSGGGSISLSPSGGTYDEGTTVTVTASPVSGYEFDHWTGDISGTSTSIDVTMNSDKSITAYFTAVNQPPSVFLPSPAAGSTVNGTVTVEGTASDSDGSVESVQVKIDDGTWQAASGTDSWTYSWDTTTVDNGNHTIRARSYDGEDYSDVPSVTVEVFNNHPPSVEITSPQDGDTVNGTVVIKGTASDEDGDNTIKRMEIRIDGGSWMSVDNITSWEYKWNTTTEEDGNYTIEARAYDGHDYSDIDSITVTVDNKEEDGGGGIPGFEFILLLAAAGAAALMLRKGRRQA